MAAAEEPPIIISNGGVAEELAKGLKPADPTETKEAWKIILENVADLNKRCRDNTDLMRPVARCLTRGDAKIYWRLAGENPHGKESGRDAQ